MNVLFLFVSLPHLSNETSIFNSLIHEFKSNGHMVLASSRVNTENRTGIYEENGINVLRIKCPKFTAVSNNIKKALAYQEYALLQRFYVKKYFKNEKIELIITHSLPPELGYIIGGLKTFFKCPVYLIQTDFIWQDAVAFGYFSKKSPIAMYYRYWERNMFRKADYIGCPTKGNIDFINNNYNFVKEGQYDYLPFWQNEVNVEPDSQLKEEFGFKDKFVVVYGGSVGAAQRIEHIIELAEACKEYREIVFVILGRGAYLEVIKEMAREKRLTNVEFKAFLPQEQYFRFLASCDVGMIILNEKMATPNFPSKALSYLNMRVPILAALDHTTDFGNYIEENNAGLWGYSDDITTLKERLLTYYKDCDYREQVKENGYALFKEELTTHRAYQRIIDKVRNG